MQKKQATSNKQQISIKKAETANAKHQTSLRRPSTASNLLIQGQGKGAMMIRTHS
jgi:hypothetical protein